MAAALLTHGADANAKDNDGCGGWSLFLATVGVRCAAVGDRDCIDALQIWMRAHTNIHAFRRRKAPLHEAAAKGHAAVAADLLTHGADVNAKDHDSCVLPVARSAGAAPAV